MPLEDDGRGGAQAISKGQVMRLPAPATRVRERRERDRGTVTRQTIGYYAAFVALGLASASLGPTLPGLAEHTRSRLGEISYLFTARSLGYLLGAFILGRLYDRTPGHPVMATMLVAMGVTMALAPLASMLWLLTAVLFVLGMAEGVVDVGGNTLLVWVHRPNVGPFMNGLHFCFGLGAFVAPIIVARTLLASGDITWAYWALGLLMLPAAAWLLRLPSPSAHRADPDDPADGTRPALVALVALFFILYVGAEVGFGGWIYTYALNLGLGTRATAAYLTSAFWGSFTLGRLLAIPASARLSPRSILIGDLVGAEASLALILLFPGSRAALWAGTSAMGLSLASIFPVTISFAERRMHITGKVASWFFVGASVGSMTVPWLIGQLFDAAGPHVMMTTLMLDVVLAAGVFVAMVRHPIRPRVATDP